MRRWKSSHPRRFAALTVAAAAVALVAVATAAAGDTFAQAGSTLTITTPPGTENHLVITAKYDTYPRHVSTEIKELGDFSGSHTVTNTNAFDPFGCAASLLVPRRVTCPPLGAIDISLGDLDDSVFVFAPYVRGDGSLTFGLVVRGGDGDDDLWGTRLYGNNGDDSLHEADLQYGGAGDDHLVSPFSPETLDGGAGIDTLSLWPTADGYNLFVTLDGIKNDSINSLDEPAPTFYDFNVISVEYFETDGDDRVTGNAGNNRLSTGKGSDTVRGLDGNDSLYGRPGNDRLEGGLGDDYLEGGAGNDSIFGGGGADQVVAGDGDDTIRVAGDQVLGGHDTVICGAGEDTVYLDSDDVITAGCEHVTRSTTR